MGRIIGSVVLAVAVSGCASWLPVIEPGATTEAEIQDTYGRPSFRRPEPEGASTLVYATQPMGISCLMVEVDASGRVLNARDALGDRNLARVEVGMTLAQIDRLLGPHRTEVFFPLSGEWVWDWNVPHFGPGIATRFNVHFKEGVVVRASRSFVPGGPTGGSDIRPPMVVPCPRCEP